MEFKRAKIVLISLALIIGLIWAAIFQLPDNRLHLVFCDVGQGDAILIYQGSTQILVDGGPNQSVLNCLSNHLPFWDREIEMVVATHPEADHITGLIDVIERYDVKQFVVNSFGKSTAVYQEFQAAVLKEQSDIYFPKEGDKINLGSLKVAVLWPQSQEKILGATTTEKEINDTSVVFQLSYGNFCALFSGDISSKVESRLDRVGPCQVLKIAHHGSKYSTSEEFLQQVKPEFAVISVGKNPFGHPTEEVLERLRYLDTKILRTDQTGEIEVVSDGKNWYHIQ
ncbi:MBL fold metallo-hydrolase [Patescibacteria group bacterium]|nr:MBL fold metallo-hydrolase [Patescibacteria group bacterium]